ncbi:hypothetical protein PCIT_a0976 [Pseudoalteromonas citrea]|uniref:M23ase beta-sheet core domain-containing protein n=2 Tax=Pseudoalteromonas citrea TaxID=43655 RepID=A0AAD4FTJ3_9GAMM|nr:hypothetical protein PCIT_a0976 [Pseudoalteromonas citrea]
MILVAFIVTALGCSKPATEINKAVPFTSQQNVKVRQQQIQAPLNNQKNAQNLTAHIIEFKKGDTLTHLLRRFGFNAKDAILVQRALGDTFTLSKFSVGQRIKVMTLNNTIHSFAFSTAFNLHAHLIKHNQNWQVDIIQPQLASRYQQKRIVITSSLFLASQRAKLPTDIINQTITALSHLIDFQREIKAGDTLTLYYKQTYLESDAQLSRHHTPPRELLYAALSGVTNNIEITHFKNAQEQQAFYLPDGKLAQSFLMKTPLNGARLSSTFGKRKHPVLGYNRLHKGLDFGAPIGTPIMAAGNGTIQSANWAGSFGNRIIIRHGQNYQTLYAHLKGFAKGIKQGVKVQQGQIIGYLGNTGLSQARHLHYEVHKNGKAINPLSLKQPSQTQLRGKQLALFKQHRTYLAQQLTQHYNTEIQIASAQ